MKIDGVVVLYHPSEENIGNISKYAPIVNKLFVMDNSDRVNEDILQPLLALPNVEYISMNGNQGIAKALRLGTEQAIEDEADFCLTMDQDSAFPVDKMPDIMKYLTRDDVDEYGIISLNYGVTHNETGLIDVDVFITSGNFINLKNYTKVYGFRDELFIDSVDHDLCHQFHKASLKVGYIGEIKIKHMIGNPAKKKLFGIRPCTVMNHSPIRSYYRYRNNYLLYHQDKKFYKKIHKADRKQLIKIILLEDNKREKLKMIRLGIKHAKKGILGKLDLKKEVR